MKKLLVVSIALLLASTAQAGLYRWVDDNGKVHFSDKVPASASKKTHTKLNKLGEVTKKVDPELKQKLLDEKAAAKREKEKLAEMRRIKAQAQAVIQERDNNLLATYENKNELIHYFESKIKMIAGNSNILEAQNSVLARKVAKLELKAHSTEDDATLKTISNKIVNIQETITQYEQALSENEKQVATVTENYQTDLARYKELTE